MQSRFVAAAQRCVWGKLPQELLYLILGSLDKDEAILVSTISRPFFYAFRRRFSMFDTINVRPGNYRKLAPLLRSAKRNIPFHINTMIINEFRTHTRSDPLFGVDQRVWIERVLPLITSAFDQVDHLIIKNVPVYPRPTQLESTYQKSISTRRYKGGSDKHFADMLNDAMQKLNPKVVMFAQCKFGTVISPATLMECLARSTRLDTLHMYYMGVLNTAWTVSPNTQFPTSLTSLSIHDDNNVPILDWIPMRIVSQIKYFAVLYRGSQLSSRVVGFLNHASNLENLTIRCTAQTPDVPLIPDLPRLEFLGIDRTVVSLELGSHLCVGGFPMLKVLVIHQYPDYRPYGREKVPVMPCFPGLEQRGVHISLTLQTDEVNIYDLSAWHY